MGNTSNGTVHQIVDNCHLNFDNCTSHSAQELFQTFDCNDITWALNWKLEGMFSRAFWENEKNQGGNILQCPNCKQTRHVSIVSFTVIQLLLSVYYMKFCKTYTCQKLV